MSEGAVGDLKMKLDNLLESMPNLKHWDDCRCGYLVGKAQFYPSGTPPYKVEIQSREFRQTQMVRHIVLPEDANLETYKYLIGLVIESSFHQEDGRNIIRANAARYSGSERPHEGFFLFIMRIDDANPCECNTEK